MSKKDVSLKKMTVLGGYIRNPVLVHVMGICPVAAAATSLVNALILAAVSFVSMVFCEVTASLFLKKCPRWVRTAIYIIEGAAVVFPVMYFLEKAESTVFTSLGIYLPLMVMSSFNSIHCEKYAVKHSVKESFFDAVASSVGYSAVLIGAGFIREILGSGKIAGFDIPVFNGFSGFLLPCGGLFIIGIIAALHKMAVIRKYPKQAKGLERRFTLDESSDDEGTFTYAVKARFTKKNKAR